MNQETETAAHDAAGLSGRDTASAMQDAMAVPSRVGPDGGQVPSSLHAGAETLTASIESSFTRASEGLTALNIKAVDALRENVNSAFRLWEEMLGARTAMQVFELQSAHARKQAQSLSQQGQDLTVLVQKIAQDSLEPMRNGMLHATATH